MTALLTVRNVTKKFATHLALDGVSLSVPKGSIYGLLGPNGAGKTTLIRIINQITGPDSGSILLDGREMGPDQVHKLGYLPEERGLYKKMKVGEQSLYLAQLKGLSRAEAGSRLRMWFDKFEIGGWWDKKVEELSKGMQQKVQFIVTVVHKPDLLIFDEPFSGFDPINVNLIKDEILALKEAGATIIFSTHNMASVEELCDHIGLIDRSKKILEGEVSQIKAANRTNTFEVTYVPREKNIREIAGHQFRVLSETAGDHDVTALIRLKDAEEKDELLRKMLKETDLTGFREVLPSINDIFIARVGDNKYTKNTADE